MAELTVDLYDPRTTTACDEWDTFVKSALIRPTWRWAVVRGNALGRSNRCVAAVIRDGTAIVGLANVRLRGRFGIGVADVEAPGTTSLPGLALPATDSVAPGRSGVDPALAGAAVEALESTVRREYGRLVQLVWYRQVFADMLPVLVRATGITYAGGPGSYFRNTFADYDAYLATLTKNRRTDQRRLRRRIDENLTVEWGPVPDTFRTPTFYELTDDATARNHRGRFPPPRSQPHVLRDALLADPDAMMLRYVSGGALVAGGLLLDHPVTPLSSAWGARSPRASGITGLWFDYMGRLISWTIESGRPGLIGGMGLIERKVELGFRPVPQWSVLRSLAPRAPARPSPRVMTGA